MRKVIEYLKPQFAWMCFGISIKFVGAIMDLVIPWILAHLLDVVVPTEDHGAIFLWGGAMLLSAVLALVTNIIANRIASLVARDTVRSLRHDLFSKICLLSCRQTDEFTIPSLESRMTSDTYNIHQMLTMMQRMGVRAPILLLGGIGITLMMEPVLTLTLIGTLPLLALVVWWVSKKGIPLYTKLQQSIDRMVRTVRENITGIRVIKALSKTEYEKKRFDDANQNVVACEKKAGITMALTNPAMNLLLNIGLTLVILVGAYRVNAGVTQPGTIIAFLTYFTIILNALMAITRIFVMYSKGSASAQRICAVLDAPVDLKVIEKEPLKEVLKETETTDNRLFYGVQEREKPPHICFYHVNFSYYKKKENVSDIHFAIRRGETLGIIGATGSGKSTIIRLLMRLYDVDRGGVYIDGKDVRAMEPDELHRKFGVVFQNDILFADTIYENIAFGREITREEAASAARCAQAGEFIDALSDGLDHMLTAKGTNLSGGQKQRVLLARALAGNPEIIVLDDSSSALDYKTDSLLRQAIREEYQGVTTVIIAQRVSSIRHADHILVLEAGQEIGYGTHEELIRTCEVYRQISHSQMGGGQDA